MEIETKSAFYLFLNKKGNLYYVFRVLKRMIWSISYLMRDCQRRYSRQVSTKSGINFSQRVLIYELYDNAYYLYYYAHYLENNSCIHFKSIITDQVISSCIFELARPFMQYPILELNCAHMHKPAYPVRYENLISVIETYKQELESCFTLWASR